MGQDETEKQDWSAEVVVFCQPNMGAKDENPDFEDFCSIFHFLCFLSINNKLFIKTNGDSLYAKYVGLLAKWRWYLLLFFFKSNKII